MPEKTHEHRLNEEITASPLRVFVSDQEDSTIVSRSEALAMAEEAGLELVEIAPKAEPPVCRVMDYGKFLFEQKKKKNGSAIPMMPPAGHPCLMSLFFRDLNKKLGFDNQWYQLWDVSME